MRVIVRLSGAGVMYRQSMGAICYRRYTDGAPLSRGVVCPRVPSGYDQARRGKKKHTVVCAL